jgi:hypothetical protein
MTTSEEIKGEHARLDDLPFLGCVSKPATRQESEPYFLVLAGHHDAKESPMELMIPLPLILPDAPISLDALEAAVHGDSPFSGTPSPVRGRHKRRCVRPSLPALPVARPFVGGQQSAPD